MVRTRIAPSPTGYPHIGTVFQALFDYAYAKKMGGQFIVRIEDTDRERYVPEAEEAIYQAFEWAGIVPDESPKLGGPYGPYRQSQRLEIYKKYAKQLIDLGHAYYCFCSAERLDQVRKTRQKEGKPPMYDRHCRSLDPGQAARRAENEAYVIRMKVPDGEAIEINDEIRGKIKFESAVVDDQVILKSDGYPTYHLAVVVDDYLMQITHVVRGEEWLSSAPKHILLYRYFDWEMPKFIHTPLLRNPDKSKLSKRHGHAAVSWYMEKGYLKEAVINFLASRVWNHPHEEEIFGMEDLIKYFKFEDMHIQGPIADLNKLNWLNGQWIRKLPQPELDDRLSGFVPKAMSRETWQKVWPQIKERVVTLSEISELTKYFIIAPVVEVKSVVKELKMSGDELRKYIELVVNACRKIEVFAADRLESELRKLQIGLGLKPRPAFMSLRLILTGQHATPPLFNVMEILGKEEVIIRLKRGAGMLE